MNDTNDSKLLAQPVAASAVYNTIGSTMSILFILALIENASVLIVYKTNSELHNKTNIWIISLIICDLLIVLNAFPLVIIASFAKEYIFGGYGCKWDGFVVTTLGTSSIYILTGLSVHRYLIMFNTSTAQSFTKTIIVFCVVLCFFLGSFWGFAPLIGWGSFSLEGIGISCAPDWRSQSTRDRTYMIAMYICVLFIPLLVIAYCYVKILFKIWREKQNHSAWLQQRRVKRDIKVTISVAFTILTFLVSWTPYAVVSLLEGFFQMDIQSVSPLLVQLPCLMAKSACIWNPIVYVCHNSSYRKAFIQTFGLLRHFWRRSDSDKNDSSDSKKQPIFAPVIIKSKTIPSKV